MDFIFKYKIIFSLLTALIIVYILSIINKPEDSNKNDNKSLIANMWKALGISVILYLLLYFIEDNDEEVYNFIDTGEPKF